MSRGLAITVVSTVGFLACGNTANPVMPPPGGTSGASGASGAGGTAPSFTGANVVDVVSDNGPASVVSQGGGYTNGLFATVKLCAPGSTTECDTIDHLLVDTGSVGVRVLQSLVTVSLPTATSSSGQALASCAPFVDGTTWGPLKKADVVIGQEAALGLTVQLIGTSTFPVASNCTGTAITDLNTLGTNGILGVGIYPEDCGTSCTVAARSGANPGYYYACAASGCAVTSVPTSEQVGNPVASFPVDNNGVMIALPAIDPSGAPSVPGQLVFGIGTQPNNDLGGAGLVALDLSGFSSTSFPAGGTAYSSIIDSGSNGLFFLDAATTKLTQCTDKNARDFYCPSSFKTFTAALLGATGSSTQFEFSVASATWLFSHADAWAFSDLAGPMMGYPSNPNIPDFDWGLPFFFGRTVFTAIAGRTTPAGPGPYIAF